MAVVVRAPAAPLAPFVERLGYYSGGFTAGWEQMVPTGTVHVLVNLGAREFHWRGSGAGDGGGGGTARTRPSAVLSAASTGLLSVDLDEWRSAVFVCFRPGGAYPFIGMPVSAIDEPLLDLESVWGLDGALLRERLLEAPTPHAALAVVEDVLLAHAVRPLEPDVAVARAVAALERGTPVAQVADRLGVSHSTLLRRFTAQVGLPPKHFARIRRLQRLLAAATSMAGGDGRGTDWARVAAECGYFDQAHLIADFRRLTGVAPSDYRPRLADPHDPELLLC